MSTSMTGVVVMLRFQPARAPRSGSVATSPQDMTWCHWWRCAAARIRSASWRSPRLARRTLWTGGAVQERLRRLNLITTVPPLAVVGALLVIFDARTWWQRRPAGGGAGRRAGDRRALDRGRLLPRRAALRGRHGGGVARRRAVTDDSAVVLRPVHRRSRSSSRRCPATASRPLVGLSVIVAALGAPNLLVVRRRPGRTAAEVRRRPGGVRRGVDRVHVRQPAVLRPGRGAGAVPRTRGGAGRGPGAHAVRQRSARHPGPHAARGEAEGRAGREAGATATSSGWRRSCGRCTPWSATRSSRPRSSPTRSGGSTCPRSWRTRRTSSRPRASTCASTGRPKWTTRASELLGQVLRETTTNILRHAQAAAGADHAHRVRDHHRQRRRARRPACRSSAGSLTLKQRLADNGGELTVEQQDGRFLTAAEFPPRRGEDGR